MLIPITSIAALSTGPTLSFANGAKIMESLGDIPRGWKVRGTPAADAPVTLRIAMTQPREAMLNQALLDMSTPGHARYGQHMKRDELKALLRPESHASAAVVAWLKQSGIDNIVDDGEWINFSTDISVAERMLHTQFHVYGSEVKKIQKLRTLRYSVPENLHQYIDMIQPTTRFGELRPQRSFVHDVHDGPAVVKATPGANCNSSITPACLRDLYSVTDVPGLDPDCVGYLGINGFLEEYARYADFNQFTTTYAPYLAASNFTYQLINGGLDNQTSSNNSVEANLDTQYGLSLSFPVNATYFSTGGRGPIVADLDQPNATTASNEPYLDFLTWILAQPDAALPHTLTTSYGEDEQSVPEPYNRRVCSMFGQLGARGVSVIFSSGDTGPGSSCQSNDGRNATLFNPIFPASCPTVTSVGATRGVNPEYAVGFSSGGFSQRFGRPGWQEDAVSAYLDQLGDTFKGLFDPLGRGFPDVAAQGVNYLIFDKGKIKHVEGTSASAPVFAGIVALLNAARLSNGLPGLGFLNPWLYGAANQSGGLTDITHGGSKGCTGKDQYSGRAAPKIPGAGWNATQGWDPVTGLGTPVFDKLLALALGD